MISTPCHACRARHLRSINTFGLTRQVTSDCRPWPSAPRLAYCPRCFLLQAVVDDAWLDESRRIYSQYAIYQQSGGADHVIFDQTSGRVASRSERLVDHLIESHAIAPRKGRLLDIGCGNGAMLKAFGARRAGWKLTGQDTNEKHRAAIEKIPGVVKFASGPPEALSGAFEIVTMIHVLEHMPYPVESLMKTRGLLSEPSLLFIEVPDFSRNPFELLLADHASHLTERSLKGVLTRAGYGISTFRRNWMPKELSVMAMRRVTRRGRPFRAIDGTVKSAVSCLRWLAATAARARRLATTGPLSIFGSSIAATWLFAELDGRVEFFVDEDPHRTGRSHLGIPIIRPEDVPRGATVFLANPPRIAAVIARRLRAKGIDCVVPPSL